MSQDPRSCAGARANPSARASARASVDPSASAPACARLRPPTSRRGRRRGRSVTRDALRRHGALALVAFAVMWTLAACQSGAQPAPSDAWTETDLAGVFDLSELGVDLVAAPDGDHLLLDGRVLPSAVLAAFPHLTMGRSLNLLRLGDDALAAMAPQAAEFLVQASPGELRDRLARYGLDVAAVRATWGDTGSLDLAGLHAAAARLDAASGGLAFAGTGPGARLLADLGLAR